MTKQLAKLFLILALCPTVSLAQGRHGGARGGALGGSVPMDEQTTVILLSGLLNLSAAQQQQLGAVFDAAVITAEPIATQMEADKEVLFEAVKSGKSDDEIKNLAEHEGSLASRMLALQAQTFSNMWRLLNSEQKSKVDVSTYGYIGRFLFNAKQPVPPPSVGEAPARPPAS